MASDPGGVSRFQMWQAVDLLMRDETLDAEAYLAAVPDEQLRGLVDACIANMAVLMRGAFKELAPGMVQEYLETERRQGNG